MADKDTKGFQKPGESPPPGGDKGKGAMEVQKGYFQTVLGDKVILTATEVYMSMVNGHPCVSFHEAGKKLIGAFYLDEDALKQLEGGIQFAKEEIAKEAKATK